MNKSTFVAFLAGVAIGSFTAWYYAKKKYEQIAQEEIDSVKEAYAKREETPPSQNAATVINNEKPDILEYASKLEEFGYAENEKKEASFGDRPYVIPPEQFGENEDYATISLMFYADQVLADDNDQPVNNVEEIVGFDSLNHFGEYEDDSVFVRNDARKCDYEILKSLRRYSEVLAEKPYKAEV